MHCRYPGCANTSDTAANGWVTLTVHRTGSVHTYHACPLHADVVIDEAIDTMRAPIEATARDHG